MKKKNQPTQHTACFHERTLVTAVRHALPFVVGLGLVMSMVQPAASRSGDSAAAFTATQLVRQFTLKNTVTQVSLGMQGYVAEVDGQQRGPAMGSRPAGWPADMGSVPSTVNLPQRDGAGRPLGYCAWDNNSAATTADYNAGQGVANPLVYAVVSPGLNGSMQTTCADILVNGVGLGDDHVQVTAPILVSSKQYKTSVGSASDLATTPGEEGDIRLVRDTNKLYSYVNGAWASVGPFIDDAAGGVGAISYTTGKVTVADFQATTATITGAVSADSATFTNGVVATTFTGNGAGLTDLNAANFSAGVISPEFGGTGLNGAAAANGTLLIGNGSGFTLGTLTAGAGIAVLNDAGAITISNSGVLSLAGTADQIIASANNGDVVLSLPQAIATTSTPTFGGMMLNGDLTGTAATFTGAVNVGSLAALRLNVNDPTGVTFGNLIIGPGALAGPQSGDGANIAIGTNALNANTTGAGNVAIGFNSQPVNTNGYSNQSVGPNSLLSNTTGYNNSTFGANSLRNNTTGYNNSAFGVDALRVANGSFNAVLGAYALDGLISGSNNAAVGSEAGSRDGSRTLTSGSNNSFLGAYSGPASGVSTLQYATAIGAFAEVNTDNTIVLGRTTDFTVIGATGAAASGLLQNKNLQVTGDVGISGNLTIGGDFAANTFSGTSATFTDFVAAARINVSTSAGGVTTPNMIVGAGAMAGPQTAGFNNGGNTALGISALAANTSGYRNTASGYQALGANTTGYENTATGYQALRSNINGTDNTAIGTSALFSNTNGERNTAVGYGASEDTPDGYGNVALGWWSQKNGSLGTYYNTSIGYKSMQSVDGYENVGIGNEVMLFGGGNRNVSIGSYSMYSNDGDFNTTLGWAALAGAENADFNVALGAESLDGTNNGYRNVGVGYQSLSSNFDGFNNSGLGANADVVSGNLSYATVIGSDARVATSNTIALGRNSNLDQIVIGTDTRNDTTANTKLYVNGDTRLNGTLYGANATFSGAVTMSALAVERLDIATSAGGVLNNNVIIGMGAMVGAQSGTGGNTALGMGSMASNTSGFYNTATGNYSLFSNTTGYKNTVAGDGVMYNNTTGYSNTAMGDAALLTNTIGNQNTAIGDAALYTNSTGNRNTANGAGALSFSTTGSNNIAFGFNSGIANTTGSNNTFLGNEANATTGALTYATAIGSGSIVATSNTIALGRNSALDQVVIGTDTRNDTTANTKLYVNGATRLNGDLNITGALTVNGSPVGAASKTGIDNALTFGTGNLTLGTNSLQVDSGGARNTAIGQSSLTGGVNLSGTDNTALGFAALQSLSNGNGFNVAIGAYALNAGPNINRNIAIGYEASRFNASNDNVAIGSGAARNNAGGGRNLAIGTQASFFNGSQNDVVAIGYQAAYGDVNFTAGNIVALGNYALQNLSSGSNSVAIGNEALRATTSGTNNVALGRNAGDTNTTGSNNLFLGDLADVTTGALNYAAAIGAGGTVATSNTIALGRNSNVDQIVIGTDSRNDTYANTKLYVNGVTNLNGDLRGTTANFSGTVTMGSLLAQRIDVSTSTGVVSPNMIVGTGALALAQTGGGGNTALGVSALNANTSGEKNVAVGLSSMYLNNTGSFNTAIGDAALYSNTIGGSNTAVGQVALFNNTSGYSNTAVGQASLISNTLGFSNVAVGQGSMTSNTSGSENTAVGANSLITNSTGTRNIAVGQNTLLRNSTGYQNVAMGVNALFETTNGFYNTALGTDALYFNTTGYSNAALGRSAGDTNSTGNHNTFLGAAADATTGALSFATAIGSASTVATSNTMVLGRNSSVDQVVIGTDTRNDTYADTKLYVNGVTNLNGALYGTTANFSGVVTANSMSLQRLDISSNEGGTLPSSNVIIGRFAMAGAQIGTGGNTAVGYRSMRFNTSGSNNAALGYDSLINNTTGSENSAFGRASLTSNTSGSNNSAFGRQSMQSNTIGFGNSAFGIYALQNNSTSGFNSAFGSQALQNTTGGSNTGLGQIAGFDTTTGEGNTFVGAGAGRTNITGSNNTALGLLAQPSSGALTYATVIGADARVSTSNTIALGRTSDVTVIGATGDNGSTNRLQVTGSAGITGNVILRTSGTGSAHSSVIQFGLDNEGTDPMFLGRINASDNNSIIQMTLGDDPSLAYGSFGDRFQIATTNGTVNHYFDSNGSAYHAGTVTMGSLIAQRIDVSTSAGGVGSPNLIIGTGAMTGAQSGFGGNTVVGINALAANTTGNFNAVFGFESLRSNTSGYWNTAVGPRVLGFNTTGNSNTGLGAFSLFDNTTGSENTAVGTNALFKNTTGYQNTAIGMDAGFYNSTGYYNVAVGSLAMVFNTTGYENTSVGAGALNRNTTGYRNTALGRSALLENTTGYDNTSIGNRALLLNTIGFENTAVGKNALRDNTSGNRNSATGIYSLDSNTTGSDNTAMGFVALAGNSTGNENVAMGNGTLQNNTTGNQNTAIGGNSGFSNTTGSRNTFIGYNADATTGALSYATAIGSVSRVATSNTIALGRSDGSDQVVIGSNSRNDDYTNTKLYVNGAVHASSVLATQGIAISTQGAYLQWNRTSGSGATYLVNQKGLGGGGISFGESTGANAYAENMYLSSGGNLNVVGSMTATAFNVSSDRRLKTNINQLDTGNVLDKLEALRTYSYNYIANRDLGSRIGVIAQELQPLFPEAVAVRSDGFMAVDYNALGAMAAVGVGQLNGKFKVLDNRVTEQGTLITALDEKVSKVDTRVASLETWKTEAIGRMDGFQIAIDSNVQKIAENALAIQSNTTDIKRLDDVLVQLDGSVKGNTESIKSINARWGNTFSASEDGSLLTVIATELKVSNFTAQKIRSGSVYTQRLEAEMAAIRELEVDSLKANTAVANSVQAKMVNTGAAQVYAGVGAPAFLFSAPSDGHYTVNTSAMDGSYATATVIVNAGQAKVVPIASEGIELMAIGNTVKANAAGKSIKASWIKTG